MSSLNLALPMAITIPLAVTIDHTNTTNTTNNNDKTSTNTNTKPYIAYTVSVSLSVQSWTINRRYSDFLSLHAGLLSSNTAPSLPSLPPKSFFWKRFDDPGFVEERRRALELYLQACCAIPSVRESLIFKQFLNFPSANNNNSSSVDNGHWKLTMKHAGSSTASLNDINESDSSSTTSIAITGQQWIQTYRKTESVIRDLRAHLSSTFASASSSLSSSSANISATKAKLSSTLVSLNTTLESLEAGLKQDSQPPTTLGSGELTRRRNLLLRLRDDLVALERFIQKRVYSSNDVSSSLNSYTADRKALLQDPGLANVSSSTSIPTPTPTSSSSSRITTALDNNALLTHQTSTMTDQDALLDTLSTIVQRQKQIGMALQNELQMQNRMLEEVESGVDKVNERVNVAGKRLDRVRKG